VWTDGVLVLRPWAPADAGALAAAWADADIAHWTAVPTDRSETAAAAWIAGWDERRRRGLSLDLVVAAVTDEATVLGEVGAAFVTRPPQVGWWLLPGARGRGLATRAVRLFCDRLFAAGAATELVADIDPGNPASRAVAIGAGFTPTGRADTPGPDMRGPSHASWGAGQERTARWRRRQTLR
jgi:ribosomal-protein-alanine N-acetyltransferase